MRAALRWLWQNHASPGKCLSVTIEREFPERDEAASVFPETASCSPRTHCL